MIQRINKDTVVICYVLHVCNNCLNSGCITAVLPAPEKYMCTPLSVPLQTQSWNYECVIAAEVGCAV